MNRKIIPAVLIAISAMLSAFCTNKKQTLIKAQTSAGSGFAVVELFTSEGCSSCPAADKAVEDLAKQYPDNVYVLAFHVDYWNRLGWTDEFSSEAYTARQNAYARQFNLESIYTPQVVINGRQEFVGSDRTKLQTTSTNEFKKQPSGTLEIGAVQKNKGTFSVHYKTAIDPGDELHIALVQNEATTDVKRGENGGHQLHHINIVRDFKTVGSAEGTVELKLPPAIEISQTKVIAYHQKTNGVINAVQKISVGGI